MVSVDIQEICLVGAGGIGSNLVNLIAPSLRKRKNQINLTILDSDLVEEKNTHFQQFSLEDIGLSKVVALERAFSYDSLTITAIEADLDEEYDLSEFDLVICSVDNAKARKIVQKKAKTWIDLRSTGDGCVYLSNECEKELIDEMTGDEASGSCQQEGAIEAEFIEFGFAIAASIGSQWIHDHLRFGKSMISSGIYSIRFGQLNMPKMEASQ